MGLKINTQNKMEMELGARQQESLEHHGKAVDRRFKLTYLGLSSEKLMELTRTHPSKEGEHNCNSHCLCKSSDFEQSSVFSIKTCPLQCLDKWRQAKLLTKKFQISI